MPRAPTAAPERIHRIFVAVDRPRDLLLVDHAAALAEEHHARIELVAGVQRPWCTAYAAADAARLEHELELLSAQLLQSAVARIGDIPVCLRQVAGSAAAALARRGDERPGDVVLVARRPRWYAGRRSTRCPVVVVRCEDDALPATA